MHQMQPLLRIAALGWLSDIKKCSERLFCKAACYIDN